MPAAQRKHSSLDVMRGQNSAKSYAFVFAKLNALFKKADGHGADASGMDTATFFRLQTAAKDQRISREEFNRITWGDLEAAVGAYYMTMFKDTDGDGDVDMDDVWKMLDSDKSGDLTFDEFTCTLMGRPPVIQEAFMVYSEEGEMPAADLGLALRAIGYNPSEVQVMDIVNKYDVNADGKIDNGEWKQICNSLSQNLGADYDEKLIADIKENFQLLAKGQSTISTSELAYVACNLGDKLDPEEAKEMIAVVDANGDGQVDADEFLAMRGAPLAAFEPEL